MQHFDVNSLYHLYIFRSHTGGGNLASNLAARCSEGYLAHSFQSFNTCYTDTGLWGIYFVADKMKIDDMVFNVQNEWYEY